MKAYSAEQSRAAVPAISGARRSAEAKARGVVERNPSVVITTPIAMNRNHSGRAEAAKSANIQHCFVEQEAFTVPWVESLKMDVDYMKKVGAVA